MATKYPAITGSILKVERAKEHVRQLESEIRTFFDTNPYSIVVEDESDSGGNVYRLKIAKYPPPRWGTIIGDIVNNLRTSLDYLICDLVALNGGVVTRDHGFPISRDADSFKSGMLGKVQGINSKAIRLLERLKPYQGGNDAFWQLHELRNADQHRLLTTVGAAHQKTIINIGTFRPGIAINPANKYPLEDGAVLHRISSTFTSTRAGASSDEFAEEYQFTFDISFDQGQIVEGEPVIPFLRQLSDFTQRVINMFERHIVRSD